MCEPVRHNRFEHMRPMLVKFPLSRSFGICKAAALLHPAITAEQKFFGALGLRVQKEQIFLQEKAKAQLIVCLLTSILTHDCDKFAFLNRMGFESVMPN